jgi:WhiB family redox-sensing transcriptional regulator
VPELRAYTVARVSNQLSLLADPPSWASRSACEPVTARLFHSADNERGTHKATREHLAKGICSRCPVRAECLTYAVDTREHDGVWGGTTPEERVALIRAAEKRAEAP